MSQQMIMIFVDRIAFGGVLSLSKEIGKIRHSTVTLLLTTITEVLTDAHIEALILIIRIGFWGPLYYSYSKGTPRIA